MYKLAKDLKKSKKKSYRTHQMMQYQSNKKSAH